MSYYSDRSTPVDSELFIDFMKKSLNLRADQVIDRVQKNSNEDLLGLKKSSSLPGRETGMFKNPIDPDLESSVPTRPSFGAGGRRSDGADIEPSTRIGQRSIRRDGFRGTTPGDTGSSMDDGTSPPDESDEDYNNRMWDQAHDERQPGEDPEAAGRRYESRRLSPKKGFMGKAGNDMDSPKRRREREIAERVDEELHGETPHDDMDLEPKSMYRSFGTSVNNLDMISESIMRSFTGKFIDKAYNDPPVDQRLTGAARVARAQTHEFLGQPQYRRRPPGPRTEQQDALNYFSDEAMERRPASRFSTASGPNPAEANRSRRSALQTIIDSPRGFNPGQQIIARRQLDRMGDNTTDFYENINRKKV